MSNEFRLKNIQLNSDNNKNSTVNYTLDFSDGKENKTISLTGNGKLKEIIKI